MTDVEAAARIGCAVVLIVVSLYLFLFVFECRIETRNLWKKIKKG